MNYKKKFGTLDALLRYPYISYKLQHLDTDYFFVFPFYATGGAERVHLEILKLIGNGTKPACFITEASKNSGFLTEFMEVSTVIYLSRWGTKASFVPKMAQKIAKVINQRKKPVVFGSNSQFFYDLIPFLQEHVRVIDLIHSFVEKDNEGLENYSLPVADRINARIVLGEYHKGKLIALYERHHRKESLAKNIHIISNKGPVIINKKTKTVDSFRRKLHILFVARNSPEKRPDVFFSIAQTCIDKKLPVHFTVVGDFDIYRKSHPQIDFKGHITKKSELYAIYDSAHLIVCTSIFEGFPMVFVEAMTFGVIPLSVDVGEIPNYISQDRETGFLISNTHDTVQLTTSFYKQISVIVHNKEILLKYSQNCAKLVEREFNSDKFSQAYKKLILDTSNESID